MPTVRAVAEIELSTILPWILYPWLLISLSVYAYRLWARRAHRDPSPPAPDTTLPATRAPTATPPAGSSAPGSAAGPSTRVTRLPLGPPSTASPVDPDLVLPDDRPGSLVQNVIRDELAARKRAEGETTPGSDDLDHEPIPVPARSGLFSPAGESTESTEPAPPVMSVADALRGIDLPCDLTPVIVTTDPDPTWAGFLTSGYAPAAVGAALGDELERLGYAVASESDTVAVATKGTVTVRVHLHPDAKAARRDGELVFPSAPGGSVGVEFATS